MVLELVVAKGASKNSQDLILATPISGAHYDDISDLFTALTLHESVYQ